MNYRTFILLVSLLIGGCASAQPVPTATLPPSPTVTPALAPSSTPSPAFTPTQPPLPPGGREIIFDESGNRALSGTLYGEGETTILLANMSVGGERQWSPLVAEVDRDRFTAVTFNYRNINDPAEDIALILGWLREAGFGRVICIGASMGTRACNSIAREPEIAGLVLIAGSVHHASVAEAAYPKLFISGALDVWAFDIQRGFEQAAEPRELVLFEENRAHGTDLFSSKDGEQFLDSLIDFVNSLASP